MTLNTCTSLLNLLLSQALGFLNLCAYFLLNRLDKNQQSPMSERKGNFYNVEKLARLFSTQEFALLSFHYVTGHYVTVHYVTE